MRKKFLSILVSVVLVLSMTSVVLADDIYKAEDAILIGEAWFQENEHGGFIGGYDDPSTDWIEFPVTVPSNAIYDMELSYATPMDDATIEVSINGNETVVSTPSTGDWADSGFETTTFHLELEEGENTVIIKQYTEYVQINYLKVFSNDSNNENSEVNEAVEEMVFEDEPAGNPATGDSGIGTYMMLAVVTLGGMVLLIGFRKKALNSKQK